MKVKDSFGKVMHFARILAVVAIAFVASFVFGKSDAHAMMYDAAYGAEADGVKNGEGDELVNDLSNVAVGTKDLHKINISATYDNATNVLASANLVDTVDVTVEVSDPTVVEAGICKADGSGGSQQIQVPADQWDNYSYLYFSPKKAGNATISFRVRGYISDMQVNNRGFDISINLINVKYAPKPAPTGIKLPNDTPSEAKPGDELDIPKVTAVPDGADLPEVKWESSDPEIAKISDDNKKIIVLKPGTVTITGTPLLVGAPNPLEPVSFKLTVKEEKKDTAVTGVTLSPTSLELAIGETKEISASVAPAAAPQDVKWSSSDPSVASVEAVKESSGGLGDDVVLDTESMKAVVKGLKEGETTITATSASDPTFKAVCTVKIKGATKTTDTTTNTNNASNTTPATVVNNAVNTTSPAKAPKTGEDSAMIVLLLAMISGLACAGVFAKKSAKH